ncbi:MAG: DJ-1/PfpI family protein [Patescibacteria group bacterium]
MDETFNWSLACFNEPLAFDLGMRKIVVLILVLIVGFLIGGVLVFKKGGEEKEVKIKMENLKFKVLLVVAPKNFRDEEFLEPKKLLEESGITTEVASKGVNEAVGMFGAKTLIDKDLSEVNPGDYDAVVFIGGTGASIYFTDQTALGLAKSAYEKGKVVGAICIAPSILANSGILSGKNATSFSSEEGNLKAKGANYTGETVTVDGKIVTARGPEAAEEFGKKLVEVLQ